MSLPEINVSGLVEEVDACIARIRETDLDQNRAVTVGAYVNAASFGGEERIDNATRVLEDTYKPKVFSRLGARAKEDTVRQHVNMAIDLGDPHIDKAFSVIKNNQTIGFSSQALLVRLALGSLRPEIINRATLDVRAYPASERAKIVWLSQLASVSDLNLLFLALLHTKEMEDSHEATRILLEAYSATESSQPQPKLLEEAVQRFSEIRWADLDIQDDKQQVGDDPYRERRGYLRTLADLCRSTKDPRHIKSYKGYVDGITDLQVKAEIVASAGDIFNEAPEIIEESIQRVSDERGRSLDYNFIRLAAAYALQGSFDQAFEQAKK